MRVALTEKSAAKVARKRAHHASPAFCGCFSSGPHTLPKEPFVGEFIDHPAVEPRMWLWQTWKYGVQGILIWDTDYCTSPSKFPESLQNPWEDPMSYSDQTAGAWGNGDGRFLYPPNLGWNDERKPEYTTGPVDSLRWEIRGEGVQDWEYFNMLAGLFKNAKYLIP